MKIAKLASCALIMSCVASGANAYYVDGPVGKASIVSKGGCVVPAKIFPNAGYGDVYDDMDNYVGYGLVDLDADEIIALEDDYAETYTLWYDTPTFYKTVENYFEDFGSWDSKNYIENKSGCSIASIMPTNASSEVNTYIESAAGWKGSTVVKVALTGWTDTQYTSGSTTKYEYELESATAFAASIVFVASGSGTF